MRRAPAVLVAIVPLVLLGLAAGALAGDDEPAKAGPVFHDAWPPPRTLSAWRLFEDGAAQRPAAGVLPYDVNTPLFSDYAAKHRFVWIAGGGTARYDASEPFAFPVGTVLVKTFAYPIDARAPEKGERLIETRLLVHRESGWIGLPYVWNAEQTEALLKVAGGIQEVAWTDADGAERELRYVVPNMNQCKSCHEQAKALTPLGPTARNLNREHVYEDGATANQLARWTAEGLLEGAPAAPDAAPRLPVWDDPETGDLAARARAWLEVNCAHCHNPDGPGDTAGLDLRSSVTDRLRLGVGKTPVAAGKGSGGRLHGIVPGEPDESILIYRIESTKPGEMMPEVGRRLPHAEGIALVRAWIERMNAAAD